MTFLIILLVILIFGFLVFIHELGHFVAAKRAGVTVEEFGFGFPPKVASIKRGGTVYSINLLPLGGFVRMAGESAADTRAGTFGAAGFAAKSRILLAGVVMNALAAYVIIVGLCLTGIPPVIANQFSFGTTQTAQPKQVLTVDVAKDSPAARAGLKRGDLLLSGNDQKLTSEDDLLRFTKEHAGQKVSLRVSHRGTERTVEPTLRPPSEKNGYLGVTPFQTYKIKYNFVDSVITAAGLTLQLMYATLVAFAGLIGGLFVHGRVSDNVSGPVGIVVLLKSVVDIGAAYVFIFIASISVSLAVVNALPLPALDGGRLAIVVAQRISGKSLNTKAETAVHAAGFAALIVLMIVVTFFDIKRLG